MPTLQSLTIQTSDQYYAENTYHAYDGTLPSSAYWSEVYGVEPTYATGSTSVSLSGLAIASQVGQVGTLGESVALTLATQAITSQYGTPTESVAPALATQAIPLQVGTLGGSVAPTLATQAITPQIGSVTETHSGNVFIASQSVAMARGALSGSVIATATNQSITTSYTNVVEAITEPLQGISIGVTPGDVTTSESVSCAIAGLTVVSSHGNVTETHGGTVDPISQTISTQCGSITTEFAYTLQSRYASVTQNTLYKLPLVDVHLAGLPLSIQVANTTPNEISFNPPTNTASFTEGSSVTGYIVSIVPDQGMFEIEDLTWSIDNGGVNSSLVSVVQVSPSSFEISSDFGWFLRSVDYIQQSGVNLISNPYYKYGSTQDAGMLRAVSYLTPYRINCPTTSSPSRLTVSVTGMIGTTLQTRTWTCNVFPDTLLSKNAVKYAIEQGQWYSG